MHILLNRQQTLRVRNLRYSTNYSKCTWTPKGRKQESGPIFEASSHFPEMFGKDELVILGKKKPKNNTLALASRTVADTAKRPQASFFEYRKPPHPKVLVTEWSLQPPGYPSHGSLQLRVARCEGLAEELAWSPLSLWLAGNTGENPASRADVENAQQGNAQWRKPMPPQRTPSRGAAVLNRSPAAVNGGSSACKPPRAAASAVN